MEKEHEANNWRNVLPRDWSDEDYKDFLQHLDELKKATDPKVIGQELARHGRTRGY